MSAHNSSTMSNPKLASPNDPLAFFRTLPPSRTHLASDIAGNVPLADKQLNANILAHFVGSGNDFGNGIGKRLRLVQFDVVQKEESGMEAQAICEIEVEEGDYYTGKYCSTRFYSY